jgi:protein-S-isoprenylcysteine O-methyltransferase Ste14
MPFIWRKPKNGSPDISRKQLISYLLIFVFAPIITYVIGKALDHTFGFNKTPEYPWNLITGFTVFFSGLVIGITSTRQLYNQGLGLPWGEVKNEVSSKKLVTSGLYAYTRNPMIIGYSSLPCGMGLMFQSPSMTFIIPAIVVLINIGIVKLREEPNLEKRFGDAYIVYKKNTPFLFPKMSSILKFITRNK